MPSYMHSGSSRVVMPRLASLPFMHGDEQGCHGESASQYTVVHVPVLHALIDSGSVTFAATQADVPGCSTPSTMQNTSRYCQPPPHAKLHTDHSPAANDIKRVTVALVGYNGVALGVAVTVVVAEADALHELDSDAVTDTVCVTLDDSVADTVADAV